MFISAVKLFVKSSVGPNNLELFLLVEYVKKAAQIYHGLIPKTIRDLAFKLTDSNIWKMPTKEHSTGLELIGFIGSWAGILPCPP